MCPFEAPRTVMPDVPVEPAVLGAGLGLEGVDSEWFSAIVLMARCPSKGNFAIEREGGGKSAFKA